jgi:hypothetical protein
VPPPVEHAHPQGSATPHSGPRSLNRSRRSLRRQRAAEAVDADLHVVAMRTVDDSIKRGSGAHGHRRPARGARRRPARRRIGKRQAQDSASEGLSDPDVEEDILAHATAAHRCRNVDADRDRRAWHSAGRSQRPRASRPPEKSAASERDIAGVREEPRGRNPLSPNDCRTSAESARSCVRPRVRPRCSAPSDW